MDNYIVNKKIKFKDIRSIIDRLARISVCEASTLTYENYKSIKEVPDKYDDLFVVGVGLIDSECNEGGIDDIRFKWHLEIVVAESPYYYKNDNDDYEERYLSTKEIKDMLFSVFKENNVERAILYGAYCKEKPNVSDVVNIGVEGNIDGLDFFGLADKIQKILDIATHLEKLEYTESDIKDAIINDGIVIYEKNKSS